MKTTFSLCAVAFGIVSALASAPATAGFGDAPAQVLTENTRILMTQTAAIPGDSARSEPRGPMTEASDRFGSPAGDQPYDREIRLGPNTRSVSVSHYETIRFVAADGREFRWRFDTLRTLDRFPLSRIAPADIAIPPGATVHITGDIPLSP